MEFNLIIRCIRVHERYETKLINVFECGVIILCFFFFTLYFKERAERKKKLSFNALSSDRETPLQPFNLMERPTLLIDEDFSLKKKKRNIYYLLNLYLKYE